MPPRLLFICLISWLPLVTGADTADSTVLPPATAPGQTVPAPLQALGQDSDQFPPPTEADIHGSNNEPENTEPPTSPQTTENSPADNIEPVTQPPETADTNAATIEPETPQATTLDTEIHSEESTGTEQVDAGQPIPSATNPVSLTPADEVVPETAGEPSPDTLTDAPSTGNATLDCPPPDDTALIANLRPYHPELAEPAMELGNYAEAYYHWRPAAEDGDAEAQYGMGWMYHNGYGLAIDDAQALYWWTLAAGQNHVEAIFSIAMLYNMGSGGISRDMDQAVEFYLRAASLGHEDAKLVLRGLLGQGEKAVLQMIGTMKPDEWELLGVPLQVRVRRANTRAEPNNQAAIITTLDQGHRLIELSRKEPWVQVGITGLGKLAWIFETLVEPIPIGTASDNAQNAPETN